jgi:hypothetical protein
MTPMTDGKINSIALRTLSPVTDRLISNDSNRVKRTRNNRDNPNKAKDFAPGLIFIKVLPKTALPYL